MAEINADAIVLESVAGLDADADGLKEYFTTELSLGPDKLYRAALTLRKDNGQRIRCLLTSPRGRWRALIVITSGFGRTMRHSNALAITAAHHGYASLRYDPTNHVGDSDGDIFDATLSQGAEDLLFVCKTLRSLGWNRSLFVTSTSLSALASVLAIRQNLLVDGMILTLPVVHLAETLAIVTGEDKIVAFQANKIKLTDSVEILTHKLSARFLGDAIENNYYCLQSIKLDLCKAVVPIAMIAAEGDEWVSLSEVVEALEPGLPNRKLYQLENTTHDSYSFDFIRTVTKITILAIAEMNRESVDNIYEVTFSTLSRVVQAEKKILRQAREIWRTEK